MLCRIAIIIDVINAVKSNSEYQWKLYKQGKISVNKLIKKYKSDYYNDLINKNKGDYNAPWKTINEITSRKSSPHVTCFPIDGNVTNRC